MRIGRSDGGRFRKREIDRLTNTARSRSVEKVNRVEKALRSENHSSINYLYSYKHYERALNDLKQAVSFFSDGKKRRLHTLVKKYNTFITSLATLDRIHNTDYVYEFHRLFLMFQDEFKQIGIEKTNDDRLRINPKSLKRFHRQREEALQFIGQFNAQLIERYKTVFEEIAEIDPHAAKGIFIEEES